MTDASVCPTGAAGYGFWIVSERGGTPGSGAFKESIKDSYEGEYKAVVNAINFGVRNQLIQNGDSVLVQLDSKGVVALVNNEIIARDDLHLAQMLLTKLTKLNNIQLTARHVKGHTGKKDQRSKANYMCDKRAREGMLLARERNDSSSN